MNKSYLGLAVVSLAFAGAARADDQGSAQTAAAKSNDKVEFKSVDVDKDGRISQSEARTYGRALDIQFSKLDGNKDQYLSQMEFGKWQSDKNMDGAARTPVEPGPAPRPTSPTGPAPSDSKDGSAK